MSGEVYRHLAAVGFAVFWLPTIVAVLRVKGERPTSISGHLANGKRTTAVSVISGLVSAILLMVFFVNWFFDSLNTSTIFNAIILVSFSLYLVAGVLPDKPKTHKVHMFTAISASLLLPPAMFLLVINQHLTLVSRLAVLTLLAVMIAAGVEVRIRMKSKQHFFIPQAIYFLCFDSIIVYLTYFG